MSFARYSFGLVLAGVAVVPVAAGAWSLRDRLLPSWTNAPARLAEVTIGLSIVSCTAHALGAVGLFSVAPVVTGMAAAGAATCYIGRRLQPRRRGADDDPPAASSTATTSTRGHALVAMGAIAVVFAEWSARTVTALRRGMEGVDTLWYHLPHAARFVQEGSITGVHFVDSGADTAFYPASSPVLHALGMLFLGNDLLSPLLNLGWLALALLAAWCVGRPFGTGAITLTGAALLLATPGLVATQPGGGYNDVVGLALLLASIALLVNGDRPSGSASLAALSLAALAAGLALGTKVTFIAPVAALSVAVVLLSPRGTRRRRGGLWLLLVGVTGGFWYVRNLVVVGNPLPGLDLELGPLRLPGPPARRGSRLAEYVFDGSAWEEFLLPGLRRAYGPVWWALVALAVAGLFTCLFSGRRTLHRALALVGIFTAVAFVVTPQSLSPGPGGPEWFVFNVRYSSPAWAFGLVLLPVVPALGVGRRAAWLLTAYVAVLAFTQLDATLWPTDLFDERFVEPVSGADSVAGLAVGVIVLAVTAAAMLAWRDRHRRRGYVLAGLAVACIATLAGGYWVQELYLRGRYADSLFLPAIFEWAKDTGDARIGIVNFFLQHPLYGDDLSNHVQYVGDRGPHGTFEPITECADWRRAVNAGRYSYVIVAPGGYPVAFNETPEGPWTRTDPAARLELRTDDLVSLFRIDGRLDPEGCEPSETQTPAPTARP